MSKRCWQFRKQKYEINGKVFQFVEADEDVYFYAFKDGDDFAFIMFVTVLDKDTGTLLATYERCWETCNSAHISAFVGKFMRDAEYRKQFQTFGEPVEDTLDITKSGEIVNPQCKRQIERLNKMSGKQLRFSDFAKLKTYGMDKVSRVKEDVLEKELNSDDVALARVQLPPDKVVVAMRWMKRGLRVDLAIRKVLTDMEISQNAIGSRY